LPDPDAAASTPMRPSVFLSYASGDRAAARLLRDALPDLGLEVWYDESDLGGGEAWDQKIRRQIRECDYFMPLISAQTEARNEGYFRREWRLAVERTLDMADGHLFLLPIVIDDTDQFGARVPEKFLAVQWLKVPGGAPTPALEALCRRLIGGDGSPVSPPTKKGAPRRTPLAPTSQARNVPEFPREEPGQKMRFLFAVVGWAFQSVWTLFRRLPRWLRIIAYIWIVVLLLAKACTHAPRVHTELTPAEAKKLKAISDQYKGSSDTQDVAKLGERIAHEFANVALDKAARRTPLLAIPFTAAGGNAATGQLADSTFAQVYGRVSIAHRGLVGLSTEPLSSRDTASALQAGRASHASYLLMGSVDGAAAAPMLTVEIVGVADGLAVWSKTYPATGADPEKIAADVNSNVPSLEDD
jgi:TolB-like protein